MRARPGSTTARLVALLLVVSGASALAAAPASATVDVQLSTAAMSFGPVTPGPTPETQTVTVYNTGTENLVVGSPAIVGADKGTFWPSETCGGGSAGSITLALDESCTIDVHFATGSLGSRSATMKIPTTAGTQSVTLSGSTLTSAIDLAGSGAFDPTAVGSTATRQITVNSTGDLPLDTNEATISGANASQFAIIQDDCALAGQVPSGDSCAITVRFRPTSTGSKTATLSVASDAGAPATVALSASTSAPTLSIAPATLSYGSTLIGSSASLGVTVSNTGIGQIPWTSATLSGTNADQFEINDSCALVELIGTSTCTVRVTFRPTGAPGARSALLTLKASGQSDRTVPLSGTAAAAAPVPTMSAASIPFGDQPILTSSAPFSVTITNTGNAPLVLTMNAFVITGANANNFTVDYGCASTLAPSEQCTLRVMFRPDVTGSRAANLAINSNGTTRAVPLSGNGTTAPAGLTFSPNVRHQFPPTVVGANSATMTQTVTNPGPASLTVIAPVIIGPSASQFAIQGTTCNGAVLAATQQCTVTFRFSPTAMGLKAAILEISTSAGQQAIGMTGIATGGVTTTSASTLDYGTHLVGATSASQIVTVTNTGSGPMTLGAPAVTGTDAGDYAIVGGSCAAAVAVAVNGTCDLFLRFTPSARGTRTATLQLPGSAATKTVALTGNGVRSAVSVDDSSLAFGTQPVGVTSAPLTTTVTNTGDAGLSIDTTTLTGTNAGDFVVANDACSDSELAPGGSCLITVRMAPTATGPRSATLTLSTDAGPPMEITLAGTATEATASVNPPFRDFGFVAVGHPTSPTTVTISNTSSGPLELGTPTFGGGDPNSFDLMSSTCNGATLAPGGGSCTIRVRFNPAGGTIQSATVSLAHNGTGSPAVVSLTGVGLAPIAMASVEAVAFGEVRVGTTSGPETVTISNVGTADLEVGATNITGANQADYTITDDQCEAQDVAPGESCDITVTFSPSARGARPAGLSVAHNAVGGSVVVSLGGTGIFPVPQISDDDVDFGTVDRNTSSSTTTLELSNVGNTGLVVGDVTLTGPDASQFVIGTQDCAHTTVAPASSCDVDVRFSPSTLGDKNAVLSIATDAGDPTTVTLSGTSVPKSDLKIRGFGTLYTGKNHLVTRTVESSGDLMKYKVGVVNEDSQPASFKFRLTPSGAAATAQMFVTTGGTELLTTDGSGYFVTPTILPGKTMNFELRVTPTVPGQVIAGVDVALLSADDDVIESIATETNTMAPVNGTTGFELFAGQGSQKLIGGPVSGQTVTGPALNVDKSALFKVRLKNNSAAPQQIGLRLTDLDGCTGSFTVSAKAGTAVVTTEVLAGTFLTAPLNPGKYKDVKITIKRVAGGCAKKLLQVESLNGSTVVRSSFLLANASYDPVLD
ncbi:choice-of-anchor D domain-containing protein [Nocardioides humilatus]|uniref:Choice-of-anchor D domain-containing protein n=1 Tax=Nocardioides humilatus TaxID=2607660 RepID=A0A5B1LFH2_9ACTN|nr:choice-of-anchor D domain-containing protein [Nocardioides humilatus]KAA1418928.1 choice-of-anchor D domain-containing protein [Nocardioides humilatus]